MSEQDDDLREWRDRLERASHDEAWRAHWDERKSARLVVRPQMQALLDDFIGQRITLEELRTQYDKKTRKEWDYFGFKGFGGAMFLNMIAKHLPEAAGAADVLGTVLALPADETAARARLEELRVYLRRQRNDDLLTKSQAAESNIPFFVSAWWHVQEPEAWPPYYASVRKALADAGRWRKGADPIASYFEFRQAFGELRRALGLDAWSLEALCAWEESTPDDAEQEEGDGVRDARRRVWLVAPGRNAEHWEQQHEEGIIAIGWGDLGDLSAYESREEILAKLQELSGSTTRRPFHDANACFHFAHEMKPGDVVVAKKGRTQVVGYGRITSDYRHEPARGEFGNVRSVEWQYEGEWTPREKPLVLKTLTDITGYPELVRQIREVIGVTDDETDSADDLDVTGLGAYELDHAVADLFIDRDEIDRACSLLRYKKNLVLQGPPGVGKTFVARRLAYLLLGEKDPERVSVVQFHQSYSYEDFVQGYRPEDGGFVRRDGPFLRLCNLARQDLEQPYVLIIDEINRGNLSKVLGELMMLIEADKRHEEWAVSLAYGTEGERFWVPPNLYIIGTMNTADRSLAMVDYALRRRFAFFDVGPGFASPNFGAVLQRLGADAGLRERITKRLAELNERIRKDPSLGDGFEIGHSYFCSAPERTTADEGWFANIVRFEIEPLLREYWFDAPGNVDNARALLEAEGE